MPVSHKKIRYQLFEEMFPEIGVEDLSQNISRPEKLPEYMANFKELKNIGNIGFRNCGSLVVDFGLLENHDAVFSAIRRNSKPEFYEINMKEHQNKKRLLDEMYKDMPGNKRAKALIDLAASLVAKSIENIGPYGRVVIYSTIAGQLNTRTRDARPESALFVDLMIKRILLIERYPEIRKRAWDMAGMRDTDTLRYSDVCMLDPRKEKTDDRNE